MIPQGLYMILSILLIASFALTACGTPATTPSNHALQRRKHQRLLKLQLRPKPCGSRSTAAEVTVNLVAYYNQRSGSVLLAKDGR